jgi:hypothetical protein
LEDRNLWHKLTMQLLIIKPCEYLGPNTPEDLP